MSDNPEKRIDHLEMILGRILDKAFPPQTPERQAIQNELDAIINNAWNDPDIPEAAKMIRSRIP